MSLKTPQSAKDKANAQVDSPELRSWKEKHREANAKLQRLEGELDVLFHYAQKMREQRTTLAQTLLEPAAREPTVKNSDTFVDDYTLLTNKSEALEKSIQQLKDDCANSRSECDYFRAKIVALSPRVPRFSLFGPNKLHSEDTLPYGGAESGFPDTMAVADRIIQAEGTATSVGAIIGAFGAGVAYTTIFSASRGRLDLIAWAFACFILVVISCAAFQMFSLPRHGQLTRIFRMEYIGSADQRLHIFVIFVGLPMMAGFTLLALSVALLNTEVRGTIPGSTKAIRAAGFLPAAFLGYFVIALGFTMIIALAIRVLSWRGYLKWPMDDLPKAARRAYPSILFTVKDKLFYLPGGKGYSAYRRNRLRKQMEDVEKAS